MSKQGLGARGRQRLPWRRFSRFSSSTRCELLHTPLKRLRWPPREAHSCRQSIAPADESPVSRLRETRTSRASIGAANPLDPRSVVARRTRPSLRTRDRRVPPAGDELLRPKNSAAKTAHHRRRRHRDLRVGRDSRVHPRAIRRGPARTTDRHAATRRVAAVDALRREHRIPAAGDRGLAVDLPGRRGLLRKGRRGLQERRHVASLKPCRRATDRSFGQRRRK